MKAAESSRKPIGTHCLTIFPWSISRRRTPSRSSSFWTIHCAWLTYCVAMSAVAKCSSKVMNGGRERDRGSTAPVDTFKKLNTRVKKVMKTIVIFAFCFETPHDCYKAKDLQQEDNVRWGRLDSYMDYPVKKARRVSGRMF